MFYHPSRFPKDAGHTVGGSFHLSHNNGLMCVCMKLAHTSTLWQPQLFIMKRLSLLSEEKGQNRETVWWRDTWPACRLRFPRPILQGPSRQQKVPDPSCINAPSPKSDTISCLTLPSDPSADPRPPLHVLGCDVWMWFVCLCVFFSTSVLHWPS